MHRTLSDTSERKIYRILTRAFALTHALRVVMCTHTLAPLLARARAVPPTHSSPVHCVACFCGAFRSHAAVSPCVRRVPCWGGCSRCSSRAWGGRWVCTKTTTRKPPAATACPCSCRVAAQAQTVTPRACCVRACFVRLPGTGATTAAPRACRWTTRGFTGIRVPRRPRWPAARTPSARQRSTATVSRTTCGTPTGAGPTMAFFRGSARRHFRLTVRGAGTGGCW